MTWHLHSLFLFDLLCFLGLFLLAILAFSLGRAIVFCAAAAVAVTVVGC